MRDALVFIISSIVDEPDAVRVEEQEDNGLVQLIVQVAKADMGKVIGKEGKIIRSIRNIMKMKAIKHNIRLNISLAEIVKME